MKFLTQPGQWAAFLLLLVVCTGCGKSTYRVKGTVTFEGQPLPGGGTIAFIPLGTQDIKTAVGDVNPDGTFSLMTNRPGDGSMPGDYRVVVTQITVQEPQASPDGVKASKAIDLVAPADRIPAVYSDHYQSPLTAKVEAKSLNEINIDLKRQVALPPRHLD
jgi:hypothetical protein